MNRNSAAAKDLADPFRDFKNDLSPEIRFRFNVAALTLSFLLIINILVLFKSQSNKKYSDSKISLLNNLELYE